MTYLGVEKYAWYTLLSIQEGILANDEDLFVICIAVLAAQLFLFKLK